MKYTFAFFVFFTAGSAIWAQSIHTEFGKNRVQYHDDFKNWWQYETDNFITYWYGKARFVAQPTILLAEGDHDEIQRVLEHRMNDKIEIIVYTDISDLKQSNIGLEPSLSSRAGETRIVGNKMFVYFDGNHRHLRDQIRKGIASVFLSNMLFGSNIQEIIQNALLLNIPDWYKEGVIAYAASEWNRETETSLRDYWEKNKKFHDFNRLAEENAALAGHSFWYFVTRQYGKNTISNLLYLTKISRSIDSGFEYVLNTTLETLKKDWKQYYQQKFDQSGAAQTPFIAEKQAVRLSSGDEIPISAAKVSPDGKQLAYVTNNKGRVRVYVRDLARKKDRKILQFAYKNLFQETDYNYPLLAWHPQKNELTIVYEHRDVIILARYSPATGEWASQLIPTDFQRIYSVDYINDLDYIFTASTDGYSDLYRYLSKNRNYKRITNDFFDDLDAVYTQLGSQKGFLFSTNRATDTIKPMRFDTLLPVQPLDIAFLPDNGEVVQWITRTPLWNERQPLHTGDQNILYLSDATGYSNTFRTTRRLQGPLKPEVVWNADSFVPEMLTNYQKSLVLHDATAGTGKLLTVLVHRGKHLLFLQDSVSVLGTLIDDTKAKTASPVNPEEVVPNRDTLPKPTSSETEEMRKYSFQSRYPDPPRMAPLARPAAPQAVAVLPVPALTLPLPVRAKEPYDNNRAIAANRKFALYQVTTKMDNDLLFEGLESYTGDRQQLLTMPLGLLIKANVKDIFEDYELEGGFRIPAALNGAEYFMVFNNRKYRIDRKIALYRRTTEYNAKTDPNLPYSLRSKKGILLGLYQWKYPFDVYRSVRATTSLRFDQYYQLSTDVNSFRSPVIHEKRAAVKLEYIFDNTHDEALNIKHGTRYKFFMEAINAFDLQILDGFAFDASKGFTGIIGFDARHYIPVLRRSVLALRAAGASSFGSEKMLYYIGGMENWFFSSFNDNIPVPAGDFAYKANAFQMRGFNNNIRNGTSYFLANTELRIPFMQYILGKYRGNNFIRNIQVIGFFDAGLAFHGTGPFSKENPLNNVTLTSPPLLELNIRYFRDPIVLGYGVGLRTQLLGYFIKADYAWGIETRTIQKPRLYLSFGMDF